MSETLHYFRWAIGFTAVGLLLCFLYGLYFDGSLAGGLSFLFIGAVLAVLEISLSFDNAIVNANKLKDMAPEWQRRFLTWGIVIAVFGMRVIFPLAVVAIAANIGPLQAVMLAVAEPREYARIMDESHLSIAAFGGTFLMMVGLTYFFNEEKEVDWIHAVESRMRRWASIRGLEVALVLLIAVCMSCFVLPDGQGMEFLFASVCGLLTFLCVEVVGCVLDQTETARGTAAKGGLGAFLYLEVLDASFSFDGVIGAFALTQNLFLIAIGLGIGAMYVRSMTIMLVERQTLAEFRYLEHGAFYSILALSFIMLAQSVVHVPEVITGLIGGALIAVALVSSIRHNQRERADVGPLAL